MMTIPKTELSATPATPATPSHRPQIEVAEVATLQSAGNFDPFHRTSSVVTVTI